MSCFYLCLTKEVEGEPISQLFPEDQATYLIVVWLVWSKVSISGFQKLFYLFFHVILHRNGTENRLCSNPEVYSILKKNKDKRRWLTRDTF